MYRAISSVVHRPLVPSSIHIRNFVVSSLAKGLARVMWGGTRPCHLPSSFYNCVLFLANTPIYDG